MNKKRSFYCFCLVAFFHFSVIEINAQTIRDSAGTKIEMVADPADKKRDSVDKGVTPRKAAIRSALIPGWGQVTVRQDLKRSFFRKYWKIPIIYGALGTAAGVFSYNLKWYRRSRFAYQALARKDSNNYKNIHPELQYFVLNPDLGYLRQGRNEYRKSVDYSVLYFMLLWGLNVVDATVDAHLKTFDVSDDLGLRFRPGYSEMAGTNGISLVLIFK